MLDVEYFNICLADVSEEYNVYVNGNLSGVGDINVKRNRPIIIERTHVHHNMAILNGITADKIAAWDSAEQNAKDYATSINSYGRY